MINSLPKTKNSNSPDLCRPITSAPILYEIHEQLMLWQSNDEQNTPALQGAFRKECGVVITTRHTLHDE